MSNFALGRILKELGSLPQLSRETRFAHAIVEGNDNVGGVEAAADRVCRPLAGAYEVAVYRDSSCDVDDGHYIAQGWTSA